jgi:hypothetical protein
VLVKIGKLHSTFWRPTGVEITMFRAFKREATWYLLKDSILYKRGKAGIPSHWVVRK